VKNNETKIDDKVVVYVKSWPFEVSDEEIYPNNRLLETENCTNKKVKGQKYYAWKLLEKAMSEVYAFDIHNVDIRKNNDKWESSKCHFSISHSGSVVAVALSKSPVGIDIEENNEERFERIKERFLCKNELSIDIPLSIMWTKKEAIFKRNGRGRFNPIKIDSCTKNVDSRLVELGGVQYALSVATKKTCPVEYRID
jgi:phosphopantetheinyl transferase (holo-ACP synthase)